MPSARRRLQQIIARRRLLRYEKLRELRTRDGGSERTEKHLVVTSVRGWNHRQRWASFRSRLEYVSQAMPRTALAWGRCQRIGSLVLKVVTVTGHSH